MLTFNELYEKLLKSAAENDGKPSLEGLGEARFDERQLQCLLRPESCPPVVKTERCACPDGDEACVRSCIFGAIVRDEHGDVKIDPERCTGCAECIEACKSGKLTSSRDILPVLYALKNSAGPVFAMIAPAFIGQFSPSLTPGKLRSAFKKMGFRGMIEVALFADILTLKEALEFDRMVPALRDFQITSCCCPVWVAMIRKVWKQFIPNMPAAVSPMVACGRSIKRLNPGAVTVFIGPCIAKKAEAREKDVADAVDFVLTFEEVRDIFSALGIDPAKEPDDARDHSSRAGRIYARTAGVSEAVKSTLLRLNPGRSVPLDAIQADGVAACRQLLADLRDGKIKANFIEGMGCPGGCVGGPKAFLPRDEGRINADRYGEEAEHNTPLDNPHVLALLNRLGLQTVEELLEDTEIFTRKFD